MFSIIIPIYNVSKYLPDCLDSIVNQTYKGNLEVFLVNDGSTDDSGEIAQQYEKKYPHIFKYLVKENGKTKCYTKDSSSNKVSCDAKEDFKIDYKKLKKNIIKIKKVDNEVINKVSYKKYTVSMKKSDAYNLIYDKDVMDEKRNSRCSNIS